MKSIRIKGVISST